jgi:anti-anti-sigma regulatory factor
MNYAIPEDVGIKNVKEFYARVKEMLGSSDEMILDFTAVKSIHLSVALVVMAAHREAKRLGKVIKLKNVPEVVRRQLYLSGFNI